MHNQAVAAKGGDEEEYKNWDWHDSRLTELGKSQASALRPTMEKYKLDVVLVSPLSRAILTGLLAIPEGPPFIIEDSIRERIGTHPCDQRRARAAIKADFPTVDVSTLEHEEDEKWSPEREPMPDLIARANNFCYATKARKETAIAIVTHNDFLTALLFDSDLQLADPALRIKFGNAQHLPIVLTWAPKAEAAPNSAASE